MRHVPTGYKEVQGWQDPLLLEHGGDFEGQQLYFLNTENCLIFASAEGEG